MGLECSGVCTLFRRQYEVADEFAKLHDPNTAILGCLYVIILLSDGNVRSLSHGPSVCGHSFIAESTTSV